MDRALYLGGALRGSSGAEVMLSGLRDVMKTGDARVGQQGAYLVAHRDIECLPAVSNFGSTWYTMERLTDLPIDLIDFRSLLVAIDAILRVKVWSDRSTVDLDPAEHQRKVEGLLTADYDPAVKRRFLDGFSRIEWDHVSYGLTHGDPTFDNVMLRQDGSIVMIDPIPATPAVPHIVCVDLGKILQSCYGFEAMRYGGSWHRVSAILPDLYLSMIGDNLECRAALYWCAVHLIRAVPYMRSKEVASELIALTGEVLRRI